MPADELTHLHLLEGAEIDIEGRMPWSSNATFLVNLTVDGERVGRAIYKPRDGERPLWDFPPGLHRRELAAYRLSEVMGLGLVPPTIIRDGPLGEGSMQWFVEADHQQHYFTIYENRPDTHARLQAVAVFDVVANNTDRKSGHVLLEGEDLIWAIDHGLCFAAEFKLRTVIWEFGGQPIPLHLLIAIETVAEALPPDLAELMSAEEVAALIGRARWLLTEGTFPVDNSRRRYPWPLV